MPWVIFLLLRMFKSLIRLKRYWDVVLYYTPIRRFGDLKADNYLQCSSMIGEPDGPKCLAVNLPLPTAPDSKSRAAILTTRRIKNALRYHKPR